MPRLRLKKILKTVIAAYVLFSFIYIFRSLSIPLNFDSSETPRNLDDAIRPNRVPTAAVADDDDVDCFSGVPCRYPDEKLDFRIIVLTHKRAESLKKLLDSISQLYMDGDVAAVEIWVDRNQKTLQASESVAAQARAFQWPHGPVRVHVQVRHVGIFGQWIDTWRPKRHGGDPGELVLFLEDDMSVSPFAYRWLKAANKFYPDRADMAGITLHSEGIIAATTGKPLAPPPTEIAFLYRHVSSWGFAPRAKVWREFQDWFHAVRLNATFRPYVDGLINTRWYKIFEKKGTQHNMWTMWFIYFCNERRLYTLYNNIGGNRNRNNTCLSVNRREPGLHYFKNGTDNTALLLRQWTDDLVKFNKNVVKLEFNGKPLDTRNKTAKSR